MNKPGYARRKKTDCSANPVLGKQALRLVPIFNARTATDVFVPGIGLIGHLRTDRLHATDQ